MPALLAQLLNALNAAIAWYLITIIIEINVILVIVFVSVYLLGTMLLVGPLPSDKGRKRLALLAKRYRKKLRNNYTTAIG